jgi:response regulator NasT
MDAGMRESMAPSRRQRSSSSTKADPRRDPREGLRRRFSGVVHSAKCKSAGPIYALDPDVILIDLENPSRDVLEQMFQVSRAVRRPIAMFVDQSDCRLDPGLRRCRRFRLYRRRLKKERSSRSSTSASPASTPSPSCRTNSTAPNPRSRTARCIDRAKGILMKLKGLTEDEAYVLLRSTAMREKKKIGEIAQSILTASEMLK